MIGSGSGLIRSRFFRSVGLTEGVNFNHKDALRRWGSSIRDEWLLVRRIGLRQGNLDVDAIHCK